MKNHPLQLVGAALILLLTFFAQPALAQTAYVVDASHNLVKFSVGTGTLMSATPITGLVGGDSVVGIDFRPLNGQLYALGSGSRLYTINVTTGVATQVGTSGAFTLSGVAFGMDFNPTVDRIRVVSDADQNLRLNPDSGALAGADVALAYAVGDVNVGANPNVVGVAYNSNTVGAATTTLFGIDSNLDVLVTQNPPNNGTLNTVGGLGVNASAVLSFDILTVSNVNTAYAAMEVGGSTRFYTINLTSGAATLVGTVGGGGMLRGLAVTSISVPGAPTIGSATAGNAQATLTFTAPVSNGGSAITSYTVTSAPGGITASGAAPPITVTGLANGTAYTFSVMAANMIGTGAASAASNSVTPAAPSARLINLSTRGQVQTGDNVMIGGFIIQGDTSQTVLIRAVGPNLANFGVPGVLANPMLQLFSGQTVIASNDDWGSAPNATAIQATGLAPVSPLESAILITLAPGAYTAIVSGVGGGTGVGIVEVFAQ